MDEHTESFSQLVVVGSSAGGIEALSTLVSTLPESFPAPLVIAQHLDPRRTSRLGEILSRYSTLPVRTVSEYERLAPGTVFVVPADRDIEITDHDIRLSSDGLRHPKPSIDLLLSSAAEQFGEQLIAVILTGTGSDGAAGARAVHTSGGMVVIQDPQSASYPALPLSLALVDRGHRGRPEGDWSAAVRPADRRLRALQARRRPRAARVPGATAGSQWHRLHQLQGADDLASTATSSGGDRRGRSRKLRPLRAAASG